LTNHFLIHLLLFWSPCSITTCYTFIHLMGHIFFLIHFHSKLESILEFKSNFWHTERNTMILWNGVVLQMLEVNGWTTIIDLGHASNKLIWKLNVWPLKKFFYNKFDFSMDKLIIIVLPFIHSHSTFVNLTKYFG